MSTANQPDIPPAEEGPEQPPPSSRGQVVAPEKASAQQEQPAPTASQTGETSDKESEEQEYPNTASLALIVTGLCFAVFLIILDNTIIANAIPKITDQFNSVSDIGWYGSAYLLTTSAFQLFYGKVYSWFSIKYTFLVGITIFELGSLVCGLAPSSVALIIGRAVAGIGSSGIFSGVMIIISYAAPLHRRPIIMGMLGGIFAIGSVCGPLLGGVFTDRLSWRWCFYINLPFGALTIATILFLFKDPTRPSVNHIPVLQRLAKVDLLGLVCFMPAIISLLLALQWGGSTYPWSNGRVIGLFVVAGVMGIVFALVQYWEDEDATVPPRLIRMRSVAAAAWYAFCTSSGFFIMMYYIPLWHQVIRDQSAVESGIRMLPLVIGMVIAVMLSGVLTTKIGYYAPFMLLSSTIAPVAMGLVSTWTVSSSFSQWFGYQAMVGLGQGFGVQQPLIAVQTVLTSADIPRGTSFIAFLQTLGSSVFLSVAQTVFQNRLLSDLQGADLGPGFDPASLLKTGATDVWAAVPPALLPTVLDAYNDALSKVYLVAASMSALTMLGSLAMEWKSVKKTKTPSGSREDAAVKVESAEKTSGLEGQAGEGNREE